MKYFNEDKEYINAECEKCGRVLKISRNRCSLIGNDYKLSPPVKCPCGDTSDSISKTGEAVTISSSNSSEKIIYETKMDFYTFKLYKNHLDILIFGKTTTIFLKNITNITVPLFGQMSINTMDGKVNKLHMVGEPAKVLKNKIMELM